MKLRSGKVPGEHSMDSSSRVASNKGTTASKMTCSTTGSSIMRGKVQPPAYRDGIFGILFLLQFTVILGTALCFGSDALQGFSGSTFFVDRDVDTFSVTVLLTMTFFCALTATVTSLTLLIVMSNETLVTAAFFAGPAAGLLASLYLYAHGEHDLAWLALKGFAIHLVVMGVVYLFFLRQVPFAAATLKTAVTAIKDNLGLYFLSFCFMLLGNAWFLVWTVAALGTYQHFPLEPPQQQEQVPCSELGLYEEDGYPEGSMCDSYNSVLQVSRTAVAALFVVSLYWTQQTIKSLLYTITAGTVGSWWFSTQKKASQHYYVKDSFSRACTYSFGSVCLGSLLVAILQALEQIVRASKEKKEKKEQEQQKQGGNKKKKKTTSPLSKVMDDLLEYILTQIRRLLEYFNSWALIYVGLYSYNYMTAGKMVMRLFRQRGWTSIISDKLVYRVLLFCHVTIAITSGCLAWIADGLVGPTLTDWDAKSSHMAAFGVAFLWGLVMADISLFLVEGAVRSVIVCYAEAPSDFRKAHPKLADEMKRGWSKAYPKDWHEEVAAGKTD